MVLVMVWVLALMAVVSVHQHVERRQQQLIVCVQPWEVQIGSVPGLELELELGLPQ